MSTIDLDPIRRFVSLGFKIDELEKEVSELKKQREILGETVISMLTEAGVKNIPIAVDSHLMTVYPASSLLVSRAKETAAEELIAELSNNELTQWMVKPSYPSATLAAWVRETLEQGGKIPAKLESMLSITTKVELRAVKASTKESSSSRAARNWKGQQAKGQSES